MLAAFFASRKHSLSKALELLCAGRADYKEAIRPIVPTALIDRKLPREILCYIFVCGLELEVLEEHNDILDRTVNVWQPTFPALVCSVSHRWRALARGTPELWSVIAYDCSFADGLACARQRKHIQQCIELARAADLRIRIVTSNKIFFDSTKEHDFKNDLLERNVKRARELRFITPHSLSLQDFLNKFAEGEGSPKRLERLHLTVVGGVQQEALGANLVGWSALRKLDVYNIQRPTGLYLLPMLTTLKLGAVDIVYLCSREFSKVLQSCNELMELGLNSTGVMPLVVEGFTDPFVLPRLTTLALGGLPGGFVMTLLATVQMPSLIHVRMREIYPVDVRTPNELVLDDSILKIIQDVGLDCGRLKLFEFDEREVRSDGWMQQDAVETLLVLMPQLVVLRLAFVERITYWLAALQSNAKDTMANPLLPELSKLCIYGPMNKSILSELVSMLEARSARSTISTLQRLEVWVETSDPLSEQMERLRRVVAFPAIHLVTRLPPQLLWEPSREAQRSAKYRRNVLGKAELDEIKTLT